MIKWTLKTEVAGGKITGGMSSLKCFAQFFLTLLQNLQFFLQFTAETVPGPFAAFPVITLFQSIKIESAQNILNYRRPSTLCEIIG